MTSANTKGRRHARVLRNSSAVSGSRLRVNAGAARLRPSTIQTMQGEKMVEFKLCSYGANAARGRAGVLIGKDVHDAEKLTGNKAWVSTLAILEDWAKAERAIKTAAAKAGKKSIVRAPKLLAPILYPGSYFCAAANYRDHSEAMAKKQGRLPEPDPRTLGIKPYHFVKSGKQATVGPTENLPLPHYCEKFDWEIELGAVIGKKCSRVSVEDALKYVAGYTVCNDVSVRDGAYMQRPNVPPSSPFSADFVGIKGFDKSAVTGPYITPAKQIGDAANLGMKSWVDDELMQDSSSSKMIFSTAEQIAYLSQRITLLPGDVVMTGTPAGTGAERGRFLKKGETIRMWIEKIGEVKNKVV